MFISRKIRELSFWTLDRINRDKVYSNLRHTSGFYKNKNAQEKREEVQQNLDKLLKHASETVPYYKAGNFGCFVRDYPIINKNIIKNNLNSFLSSNYKLGQLYQMITSGSTGTPFIIYQDKHKRRRNTADTIYFAQLAGYKIGHKLYYLKIWSALNHKNIFTRFIQNIKPIDVLALSENEISSFITDLKSDRSEKSILGYASALETICKYLDKKLINIKDVNIKSIIAMSEHLNDYTRDAICSRFGIMSLSRYSNIENGIIAQQRINDYKYLINTASYYVEVLDQDSDEPVKPGKVGRIIITDLFNYGMPVIRYDTGDTGIHTVNEQNGEEYFIRIEGRRLDNIYNTKGQLISSFIVYKNMYNYPEINQYQLIQNDLKHFIIKINIDKSFNKENQLIKEFQEYLGSDAEICIEYVNEIPLLASGKRKKILNLMQNEKNI